MERGLVRRSRFEKSRPDGVEQGMRRLVRHDVVGETCVDRTASRAGEISEEQAAVFLRIKSIRFGECMGATCNCAISEPHAQRRPSANSKRARIRIAICEWNFGSSRSALLKAAADFARSVSFE